MTREQANTLAVQPVEGSIWVPFDPGSLHNPKTVHAIMLADGWVWDAVNGWREQQTCPHCMGSGRK